MTIQVLEDTSHAGGGYAILKIDGVTVARAVELEMRVKRLKDQQWLAGDVWQGATASLAVPVGNVVPRSGGVDIRLGPDVVDRLALGDGLQFDFPGIGVSGRVRWPKIRTTVVDEGTARTIASGKRAADKIDDDRLKKTVTGLVSDQGSTQLGAVVDPGPDPTPEPVTVPAPEVVETPPATVVAVETGPGDSPAAKPKGRGGLLAFVAIAMLMLGAGAALALVFGDRIVAAVADQAAGPVSCNETCTKAERAMAQFKTFQEAEKKREADGAKGSLPKKQ